LAHIHEVKLRLSTAFHPQTDGQTERVNQVLERYLRCFISENELVWPKLLATAQFACNNAVNTTTNYAPFQALLGYCPDFRSRIEADPHWGRVPAVKDHVKKL
jgi:hypothetical protein